MIRFFDFIISFFAILICSVFFIFIALTIRFESKGGVLYRQFRVGRNGKLFKINKFRTMSIDSKEGCFLTMEQSDNRITKTGFILRKYKIDELPQLINVLLGDMSIVGPRPEVKQFVDVYTNEQKEILKVRPGITDYASIKYNRESELLSFQSDPKKYYIEVIIPDKIRLNKKFINNSTAREYFKIILLTIKSLFIRQGSF